MQESNKRKSAIEFSLRWTGASLLAVAGASAVHAQESETSHVPALDAELLVAHPGLVGGDMESMREDVLAALESDPTGELVLEAVLRLTQLDSLGETNYLADKRTARFRALEARVEDAEASFWLRRLIEGDALRRRFSADPLDLPGDMYGDFLSHWRIVGPLGDLTAPLATAPAPVDSPEPRAGDDPRERLKETFVRADGESVGWRSKSRKRNGVYITPMDRVHPDAGLVYALAYVRSDAAEPTDAIVEVRCQGPLRAYWNGALAIDEPRLDPFAVEERHLARVELAPGANALLIRVVAGSSPAFAARILDADGRRMQVDEVEPGESVARDLAAPAEASELETPLLSREPASGPFGPALDALRAILANRYDIALTIGGARGGKRARDECLDARTISGSGWIRSPPR